MRNRAWRREQANKKQSKRIKKWSRNGWNIDKESHKGMMKKEHFGCGCAICKPWKHNIEPKLKPSERRKCQKEQVLDPILEVSSETLAFLKKK